MEKFDTGVVDTGGNFAAGVIDTGGAPWREYLREFLKKFETVLIEYSGAGGKLIHDTWSKKSRDTVPLIHSLAG